MQAQVMDSDHLTIVWGIWFVKRHIPSITYKAAYA